VRYDQQDCWWNRSKHSLHSGNGVCLWLSYVHHVIFSFLISDFFLPGPTLQALTVIRTVSILRATVRYVDQGGNKRRGAFAIYLELWHAGRNTERKKIMRKIYSVHFGFLIYCDFVPKTDDSD
jgi:hypothetical protein